VETITYEDFRERQSKTPYYRGRWPYFQEVITFVRTLKPASVLELGPYLLPLVRGSDTMDKLDMLPGLTYHHDARLFPWPVKDKSYDLFIALQVWEHLGTVQKSAFREVMRISRAAILSFPYKWPASKGCHANIDDAVIAVWTQDVEPRKVVKVGTRIIYLFEF